MNYEGILKSVSLREEFPEKITVDDDTTMIIGDKRLIITEFDRAKDPLCSLAFEKGFTVGLKVLVTTRRIERNESQIIVRETPESYGEYAVLTPNATLMDVLEIIDNLVCSIRNQIVGEPSKA